MNGDEQIRQQLEKFGESWRKHQSITGRVREAIDTNPNPLPASISRWPGGLTMTQRITIGGLTVAAAIFAAIILVSPFSTPDLLGQVARNINKATSYSFDIVSEMEMPNGEQRRLINQVKFNAPGSYRFDQESADRKQTRIMHRHAAGIEIDHKKKSFRILPPQKTMSPLMLVEKIGRFKGQAVEQLAARNIAGIKTKGFLINLIDIDPDVDNGKAEVWVDPATDLPVLIVIDIDSSPNTGRLENFEWNLKLDKSVFDASPPVGYAEVARPKKAPAEQVAAIKDSLELFAELSGGRYPQVENVYGDVTRDKMLRMAGFEGPPDPDWMRDKQFRRINNATSGLGTINTIQRENSDSAYYGRTVGPGDSDLVLFRWRLDDGKYQVIYGDLRDEIVSAGRLKQLESRDSE